MAEFVDGQVAGLEADRALRERSVDVASRNRWLGFALIGLLTGGLALAWWRARGRA